MARQKGGDRARRAAASTASTSAVLLFLPERHSLLVLLLCQAQLRLCLLRRHRARDGSRQGCRRWQTLRWRRRLCRAANGDKQCQQRPGGARSALRVDFSKQNG